LSFEAVKLKKVIPAFLSNEPTDEKMQSLDVGTTVARIR